MKVANSRTSRRLLLFVAVLAASLLAACPALADVKLPNIFSDNMVLQRDRLVPIWGTAEAGEEVTVEFGGQKATTKAGADGKWTAKLPAMPASAESRTMTVSGKNKLEVKNVLVGEVWVCSGQSNMQWSVAVCKDGQKEIAAANHPNIRLFLIPTIQQATPAADVPNRWQTCEPATIPNFSAVGYYFGRRLAEELKVPVGLIANAWGGRRIEPFTTPDGVAAVPELAGKPQHELGIIYNGMVAPIVPFAVRGAIWYQGESNMGEGMLYTDRTRALIASWRKAWNDPDMAFLFVQLAPFGGYHGSALPELWEAQTAALAIPHTGMAVITDIGHNHDIHPNNKQDVGWRLAQWALAKTYGRSDLVPSGPLYKSMKVEGNKIRIEFAHVGEGLVARDGQALNSFEIAGGDGNFVPAKATIDGKTVLVEADAVKEPTQVRFGWSGTTNPNLMNKAGMPAGPFRTKDWHGATGE